MNHPFYLQAFQIDGDYVDSTTIKRGHLNETILSTWRVSGGIKRYVHQKINRYVFSDVPLLMGNIKIVTEHIQARLRSGNGIPEECSLQIVPTREQQLFWQSPEGECWRTYCYVENTDCIDFCTDVGQAYRAGEAIGRFERHLSDLPPKRLSETIPRFQDSGYRFEQLRTAMQENLSGRLSEIAPQLEFALSQEDLVGCFEEAQRSGKVPVRATHADPKINNILFSKNHGQGICVVDLDTCMPGTILFDFGDLCRTTIVPAAEDEQDFSKVDVDLRLFQEVSRGFLEQCGDLLTSEEVKLLHMAPQLVTLTIGVRFLADHLNGDRYFRIHRPNHNLERARTQFQVVKAMEMQRNTMKEIIDRAL
jgi:hypothetical protein